MSAPLLTPRSTSELRSERNGVERDMLPYTVELLRRLRVAGALEFKEEQLLDRYETLSWLIDE
ncbi:hypothetical protein JZY06_04220 [Corynebacterium sp. CCM 8862]|uniref:Uncharacterized protein n=1 Tax=Corynebacterium mendelii TaxID=2765362 RepID=A0A939DZS5_9CORY|nr:hypothetical protein [Corynebacterium mendelii]